MYKIIEQTYLGITTQSIQRDNGGGSYTSIPIAPDNTDYQNFKKQINADEAELLDADGNLMTAEQAKEFVSTLP